MSDEKRDIKLIKETLTDVHVAAEDALRVVGDASGGQISLTELPTLCVETIPLVAINTNSNFTITVDVDGDPIPNQLYCPEIVIVPSAATMMRLQLFATSARVPADPMWYEYDYPPVDVDFAKDQTGFWFFNRDADVADQNTIFGNIAIAAGAANPATFTIFLLFIEGRTPA